MIKNKTIHETARNDINDPIIFVLQKSTKHTYGIQIYKCSAPCNAKHIPHEAKQAQTVNHAAKGAPYIGIDSAEGAAPFFRHGNKWHCYYCRRNQICCQKHHMIWLVLPGRGTILLITIFTKWYDTYTAQTCYTTYCCSSSPEFMYSTKSNTGSPALWFLPVSDQILFTTSTVDPHGGCRYCSGHISKGGGRG